MQLSRKNCYGSTCDVTRYGKLKLLLLTCFNCWILFNGPTFQRGNQCMLTEDICRDSVGKIGLNVWLALILTDVWKYHAISLLFSKIYMVLLNHIQPPTQAVETPSPPSPIQCCTVLWALVFINLVENFSNIALLEGEGDTIVTTVFQQNDTDCSFYSFSVRSFSATKHGQLHLSAVLSWIVRFKCFFCWWFWGLLCITWKVGSAKCQKRGITHACIKSRLGSEF